MNRFPGRKGRFLAFPEVVGKRPLEDTGSPVKFSMCGQLLVVFWLDARRLYIHPSTQCGDQCLMRLTLAGSMDKRPCLSLGRRTSDTGRPVAALLPFPLEVMVPEGCPLTSSQTYMDLALGLSPVQWLEPYFPLLGNLNCIYLFVSFYVRSKLAGQCPHTSCSASRLIQRFPGKPVPGILWSFLPELTWILIG